MRILYLTAGLLTMCLGCGWGFTGRQPPDPTWVLVSVRAEGFSADEIERDVTRQVEMGLATLPQVQRVQSVSYSGETVVWSKFDAATDSHDAMQQVARALDAVNQWPDEALEPRLEAFSPGPILLVALHRGGASSERDSVVTVADTCLRLAAALQRIPHVADVSVLGDSRLQFEVLLDQNKLLALGFAGDEIEGLLQTQFLQMPSPRADEVAMLRILEEIPLRQGVDGTPTRLADVASVRLRLAEPAGRSALPDGGTWPPDWVLFGVHTDSNANADACSAAVNQALASFPLPAAVEIVRDFDEQTAQLLTPAGLAWSRHVPPDLQLRQADSKAWHWHFTLGQPDFICRVIGPDLDELRRIAAELRQQLTQDPQVTSVHLEGVATQPELIIEVDRDRADALGISDLAISHVARTIPFGARYVAGVEVVVPGEQSEPQWADVVLLTAGDTRSFDAESLSKYQLRTPGGGTVPLTELCRVSLAEVPVAIHRDQQRRYVGVQVTTGERSADARDRIQARLSDYQRQLKKTHPRYQLELADGG